MRPIVLWLAVVIVAFGAGWAFADKFNSKGWLLIECHNADGSHC